MRGYYLYVCVLFSGMINIVFCLLNMFSSISLCYLLFFTLSLSILVYHFTLPLICFVRKHQMQILLLYSECIVSIFALSNCPVLWLKFLTWLSTQNSFNSAWEVTLLTLEAVCHRSRSFWF